MAPDLPNYFELHKNTLEIFEDEKCGLVSDVCQLAKRSDADEEERQRNPFT